MSNNTNVSDCPICGTPVEFGESRTVCPSCQIVFHQECWLENKGCATYGCPQVNILNSPIIIDVLPDSNAGIYGTQTNQDQVGIGFWNIITKKYAVSEGRARRKEFWWFSLCYFATCFAMLFFAGILAGILQEILALVDDEAVEIGFTIAGGFVTIFTLVIMVPYINVGIRRMHDIGHSGWILLINFIWLIGPIIFLILCARDSEKGANKYGPNPKIDYNPPQTHTTLQKIKFAFHGWWISLLLLEFLSFFNTIATAGTTDEPDGLLSLICLIIFITYVIFGCMLFYHLWNTTDINVRENIGSGFATAAFFIPFYNIYWFPAGFYKLADKINQTLALQGIVPLVNSTLGGWAGGILIIKSIIDLLISGILGRDLMCEILSEFLSIISIILLIIYYLSCIKGAEQILNNNSR
ncbi:MAG: DUF805 domain-containing protein [Planctomycetaceae bacterium]|jgi:uncharacterized membrane protein YhaH (DUF805 family)|nr:DUF805 domain-containing protein [Planctomycetaceae bacterium]